MHGQAQPHDVGIEVTELQGRRIRRQRRKIHAEEVNGEFTVDVVEFVTPLTMFFFQVFRIDLAKVVDVERALRIDTLVDPEELAALLCDQGMVAVWALQGERLSGIGTSDESLPAYLAFIFAATTGVVVDVLMRGTAYRTDYGLRDSFSVPATDGLEQLFVLPFIVLEQELPVLFFKWDDDGRNIDSELLVLWRMAVIKSPLL